MANVNVNNIPVPRIARNKRIYSGNTAISQLSQSASTVVGVGKNIIPFTATATPSIPDYSIYAAEYGQYPTVELYAIDGTGNRVKRTELPYFILNINGLIDTVSFGTFPDALTGFILLQ